VMTRTEITQCEDAIRLLAAHLDRELDDHTHAEVERHLHACRSCYSRAEFERRLKASIAALGHEPVPPELTSRVNSLVQQFTVITDQ
jgi:anti-sigma factor (TIGR02949 family)